MLILSLNRVCNIRKIDYKLSEYRFRCISKFISSVYQMAVVLMKNIDKYIKSSTFFLKRCLTFIKYLKTFGKVIDIRINKTYPIYNDFKIYKIKKAKIEDIDVLKIEEISRSF